MKAEIHPKVYDAPVTCASCGKTWVTTSTRKELRIDVCSNCHPFFTGESARIMDIEGQVDRFYKKLSARQTYVEQQKVKEESATSPDRSIDDLELSPRATDALKKAGILSIGQMLAKLGEGNAATYTVGYTGATLATGITETITVATGEELQNPEALRALDKQIAEGRAYFILRFAQAHHQPALGGHG